MSATNDTLGTIATAGGLWGGPLLAALQNEPGKLPGTKPADYGLPPGLDLRDAARGTWTILKAAWADFDAQRRHRAEHLDTEWYGTDNFTLSRWLHHLFDQLAYHNVTAVSALTVDDASTDDPADSYPISHLWNDRVPLHLLPAGVPLDKTTPHVPGAARQSPHSTVQDYLNRTDRHMWGIVTNGLTLRLLRNNAALTRQAYVEFDLASMFADDNYVDFAVLWLALHATRFAGDSPSDCIAEQWQQHAAETGVRALDALRGGVEAAIEQIGQGLLEHPDNKALRGKLESGELDGQTLYRQLLYVAYRHVFLFAVEDRDLLHPPDADPQHVATYRQHYSTRRLRDQARRHLGGQHPDGWEIHKTVTAALANPDGQRLIALPPVLGSLWDASSTRDLGEATLTNRRYYAALRNLAFVQRDGVTHRVDYRGMGSDELGAVYEALLEVNATASATARTFELSRTAGNERKTTGSYYTPTSLIARVLDDALGPVVARAIKGKGGNEAADAILELTVCDPAMGSAHFLTGAAHRLAKHVAANRTGQTEPSPDEYRDALRDVVSRCIYGVDVNPMAVQLAKTALWLECHVPGKPLTFLDHHLKCGNALLGVGLDASLINWTPPQGQGDKGKGGVPDEAFKALHGDDGKAAGRLKKANRSRRDGVASLLASGGMHDDPTSDLASRALGIAFMDDDTPEGLKAKQQAWMLYGEIETLQREKLRADAWTACWTMPKTPQQLEADDQPFDVYYDCHYNGLPAETRPGVEKVQRDSAEHGFFHWHVEFPEIAQSGGFSCTLGNPPWGTLATNAVAWFSARKYDEIAEASNQSKRNVLIQSLATSTDDRDRTVAQEWDAEQRAADVQSRFIKASGRYEHPPQGTLELSAVFAGVFLTSIGNRGRAGLLCRESVATGKSNVPFLRSILEAKRLAAFFMFENEEFLFPGVHHDFKFAIGVFSGQSEPLERVGITGFIRHPDDIDNPDRRYNLTPEQIEAINPHTVNLPVFRHSRDALVTARLHGNVPVMSPGGEDDPGPWGTHFVMGMLHMSGDSGHFLTAAEAEEQGFERHDTWYHHPDGRRLRPLHEGKMVWSYDHRYGTYEGQTEAQRRQGVIPQLSDKQHQDPQANVLHRYWVDAELAERELPDHWTRDWLLGFRDKGTYERTMLVAAIPRIAAGHPLPLLLPTIGNAREIAFLLATLASLPFDYAVRQKGLRMYKYVVQQTPMLPPSVAAQSVPWGDDKISNFVVPRVVELSYTSIDLAPFATDMGFSGTPFRWQRERRAHVQAELHALMFLLYDLNRDDAEHVLSTFRVLRETEEAAPEKGGCGEFRTKRLVLERYDAMVKAREGGVVYDTPLDPPPADDAMRHA